MIRIYVILAMLWAAPIGADVPDRLEAAFRDWATGVGALNGAVAIRHKGQPVREVVLGAAPPVEMASLSKAITAVCAAHLIKQGIWRAETTSAEVLETGAPDVTLAQLLTHTSGLGPDQTQASMQRWLDKKGRRAEKAAMRALQREAQTATQGRFSYNNENYAVIGAMIAAQTGQAYADYCSAQVLEPAGIRTAQPSPRTQRFLPWGGWQMSVQDYAAFHWHAFGPNGIIGQNFGNWPAFDLQGGLQYGMGMFQRAMRGAHNTWHFGALCFPGRLNTGSYSVIWLNGYSVTATYDICPDWGQMGALDSAMVKAVFP